MFREILAAISTQKPKISCFPDVLDFRNQFHEFLFIFLTCGSRNNLSKIFCGTRIGSLNPEIHAVELRDFKRIFFTWNRFPTATVNRSDTFLHLWKLQTVAFNLQSVVRRLDQNWGFENQMNCEEEDVLNSRSVTFFIEPFPVDENWLIFLESSIFIRKSHKISAFWGFSL